MLQSHAPDTKSDISIRISFDRKWYGGPSEVLVSTGLMVGPNHLQRRELEDMTVLPSKRTYHRSILGHLWEGFYSLIFSDFMLLFHVKNLSFYNNYLFHSDVY